MWQWQRFDFFFDHQVAELNEEGGEGGIEWGKGEALIFRYFPQQQASLT